MTGKVYLVGAGPGDPELLTLKALKLLKSADVVLHDDLIGPEILAFIPSSTEVQNVGKRFGRKNVTQSDINALLVQNALLGLQVVRLKSGDPLILISSCRTTIGRPRSSISSSFPESDSPSW